MDGQPKRVRQTAPVAGRKSQYSESLRKLVLQLLQLIRRNLERIGRLENDRGDQNQGTHEPESAIVTQMSQWSSYELSSLLVESLKALESGVDSLLRLGVAIQQASASTLTQRINDFIEKKDDGTLEEMVYIHLKHRLVIRAQERDNTQGAALSLCRQLATSISFRYFGIIYKRSHHAKKRDEKAIKADAVIAPSYKQRISKSVLQQRIQEAKQPLTTTGKSLLQAPHLRNDVPPSDTTPSTPDSKIAKQIYMAPPKSFFGARSITSVRAPEDVRYPRAPKVVFPERFALCPFCCNYHGKDQLENKEWWECVSLALTEQSPASRKTQIKILTRNRRHVDQELRLYTCISEECIEPPQIFARFEEWKQHMDTEHSRRWIRDVHSPLNWYCSTEHDEQHFEDEAAFEKHVESQHPEYNGELELDGFKDWCAVKLPRPAFTCPVCNTVPKKLANVLRVDSKGIPTVDHDHEDAHAELLRHIAQHLKQVGFISADYLQEDDGIGSLVTDDQSRQGLPDGSWIHGEWQPLVSSYFDDDYKDYNPDSVPISTDLVDFSEVWSWIGSPKRDIVLDWKHGIGLPEELAYDDPEHVVQERLILTTALGGQDHPHIIHCLIALAIASALNKQFDEAERASLEAFKLCRRICSPGDPMEASTRRRLKSFFTNIGRQDIAERISVEFDKLGEVLSWLRPADVEGDQARLVHDRADYAGTGQWLLDNTLFKEWFHPIYATIPPLLWLRGIPGAGKTMLASLVVQEAKRLGHAPTVLYFYCKHENPERNNFVALGRSLLAQFLHYDNELLPTIHQKYFRSGEAILSSQTLVEELLTLAFENCKSAYIILDGLDECPRDQRKHIARWFCELVEHLPNKEADRLRCLFISQDDGVARKDFAALGSIKIRAEDTQRDIKIYCLIRASKLAESYPSLTVEKIKWIAHGIAESAQGLFLLAKLKWDDLFQCMTLEDLEESLEPNVFPQRLNDTYRRIMVQMDEAPLQATEEDPSRLLGWLVCAKRPLKWHEIQVMNSIDLEQQCVARERRSFIKGPKDLLGSLIEVHADGSVDLFHLSMKFFLVEEGYVIPSKEELNLAILCIDYLNLPACVQLPTLARVHNGDYGFMDYAVLFWLRHLEVGLTLKNGEEELMEELVESLKIFIDEHWNSPTTRLTLAKRHRDKLQHFETLPFYDQLEQVVASTKQQLKNLGEYKLEEDALNLARVVCNVRKCLESIITDDLDGIDQQAIRMRYGTRIFKCPRFSCHFFTVGFSTAAERDKHISKHERPFKCPEETCVSYTFGFCSSSEREKHIREYHFEIQFGDDEHPTQEDVDRSILGDQAAEESSQALNPLKRKPSIGDATTTAVVEESASESDSEMKLYHQHDLKRSRQTEFKCPHCDVVYRKRYDLQTHVLSHDPERAHVCDVCSLSFERPTDLWRHMDKHTGAKSFVCSGTLRNGGTWGCGRSFAHADTLKKHHESRKGRECIQPRLQEEAGLMDTSA